MKKVVLTLLAMAFVSLVVVNLATAADKKDKPKATPEERFAKLDTNKDGKVTVDEFVAGHPRMGKEKAEALFKQIAKDKDSFTLDDFKAYMKAQAEKKGKDKKQ